VQRWRKSRPRRRRIDESASAVRVRIEDGRIGNVARLPDGLAIEETPLDDEESPKERTDQQLLELLNELRVALPGAQFLFAFLLTVPFAPRFDDLQQGLRAVFYVCLLCTMTATILLMAPTVFHRARWQHGDKAQVIRVGHRMFLSGMAFLGLAMIAAVFLVTCVVLGVAGAAVATMTGVILLGATWCVFPLHARHAGSDEGADPRSGVGRTPQP